MQQKTILVVDDEADVVTFLTTLLEDNGYRVVSASNGAGAVQKLREIHPDLVTLDLNMPEQSGVRAYREIKSDPMLASTPVILITGINGDIERFMSTRRKVPPPDGFLGKPIEDSKLLSMIQLLIKS